MESNSPSTLTLVDLTDGIYSSVVDAYTQDMFLTPRWYNRKVAHVLDELNLTYETIFLKFDKNEQKAPEFTKYNPNGRIPALIDHHNNDFVIW